MSLIFKKCVFFGFKSSKTMVNLIKYFTSLPGLTVHVSTLKFMVYKSSRVLLCHFEPLQ